MDIVVHVVRHKWLHFKTTRATRLPHTTMNARHATPAVDGAGKGARGEETANEFVSN